MRNTILKIILLFITLLQTDAFALNEYALIWPQKQPIMRVLRHEKSKATTRNLIRIINRVDRIYRNLYDRLANEQKIVIFFDPAHGKLPSGVWQGAISNRKSCTGKPEELYSIQFSRRLYKLLKQNSNIKVESTSDFMALLKGEKDTYKNIPFSHTVKLANKAGAFILISEHLNNVSAIQKASGKVNLPGIHVTRDKRGRMVLKYVKGSYSGFLTLYNKLDASGFSRQYALSIKKGLVNKDYHANNWEFGAVGDSRFSYFMDFPISVIYENGFISNPKEEKKLRDPEYIEQMVEIQYEAFLDTIKTFFNIDISSSYVWKSSKQNSQYLDLLKLSRIAIYYTKRGVPDKAIETIKLMKAPSNNKASKDSVAYYKSLASKLKKGEALYSKGKKYRRKKQYRRARRYFKRAAAYVGDDPLFAKYYRKYKRQYCRKRNLRRSSHDSSFALHIKPLPLYSNRSKLRQTIILPIEKNQSLEEALDKALSPSTRLRPKLIKKFKNTRIVKWKRARYYSKKRKRYLRKWVKRVKKITFREGIYLVKLNKRMDVVKARRIHSVRLNPKKYQNQQYLKNSYFASRTKYKSL